MSRSRRQSPPTKQDNTNQYTGLGTAIQEIPLIFGSEEDSGGREEDEPTQPAFDAAGVEQDAADNSTALAVILGLVIPLVCVLLLVLLIVVLRRRRRDSENQGDSETQGDVTEGSNERNRKESGVSIQHGDNPYLSSFLNVRSDNENSGVEVSDSDEDEGSVVDKQTVEECESDASSAKSEDYSGDVSDDNTSYCSERFKTTAGRHHVPREPVGKREVARLVNVDNHYVTSL